MYRVRAFTTVSQSVFTCTRSRVLQMCLTKHSARFSSTQARCFTGNFLPWYKVVQLQGSVSKNKRFASPVIPCAFNSVSPVDLAKDIAAVKNADGHLYLYEQFKNSPGMTQVNRITILHRLARFAISAPKKNFLFSKEGVERTTARLPRFA